ncbi:MAG: 4Fe-4S dicluster domain-containing protein [Deltaproteobacteria bacterium]|nr:4Fe-4S dicluster domain-containing protein [Deltaproteobacteria bacterium]
MRPAPETNQPCYEILGEVERFDQRDNPNARTYLIKGSPEYKDYYHRHPELEEWDEKVREVLDETLRRHAAKNPINSRFGPAVFFGKKIMGYSSFVTGDIDHRYVSWGGTIKKGSIREGIDIDPEEMTRKIKGFGQFLGAAKVRITRLRKEWVQTFHSSYYGNEPYGKPVELNYENVICMAFPVNPRMLGGEATVIEGGWKESFSSLVSLIVAEFVRGCGWPARALPPENAPYLVVPTFVDAGMGEQGRHGLIITKEFGSHFIPGAVATDMPLIHDKPVDFGIQDFCTKCKICAERCPTGAISFGGKEVVRGVRRWNIDGDQCRLYWSKIGRACGICKNVCPWSHPSSLFHNLVREVSQSFAFMRRALIWGERIFYPNYKPNPVPDWVKLKGLRKKSDKAGTDEGRERTSLKDRRGFIEGKLHEGDAQDQRG